MLIVLAQPAVASQPGETALYYPSPWQHVKALLIWIALDDFKHSIEMFTDPSDELTSVATICPELPQVRLGGWRQFVEDKYGVIAVLDVGRMDHDLQEIAQPLATCTDEIVDRIDDGTQVQFQRASTPFLWRRQEFLEQFPFLISQITRVLDRIG